MKFFWLVRWLRGEGSLGRSAGVLLAILATGLGGLACSKPVQYGTLPKIEIPIEPAPKRAPPPEAPPAAVAEGDKLQPGDHDPPDPPAVQQREQVRLLLTYEKGDVSVSFVENVTLDEPRVTSRHMGRFAAELWQGDELIERARFDFPLLAAEEEDGQFEAGLSSQAEVLLPALARPTRLRILDRRTREELFLSWPLPEGANPRPLSADDGQPSPGQPSPGQPSQPAPATSSPVAPGRPAAGSGGSGP